MVDSNENGAARAENVDQVIERFKTSLPDGSNVGEFYDNLNPEAYDQAMKDIDWTEPENIIEAIAEGPSEGGRGFLNAARDIKIYDIGCGTGNLGGRLAERGFTNIEGGDASQKFVEEAMRRGNYKSIEQRFFGQGPDKLAADKIGAFDLVVASGVFSPGHMPATVFDDAHALCKTGGYFVTALGSYQWETGHESGFKDKFDELVAAGKFETVFTREFTKFKDGVGAHFFRTQGSLLFVAKRLD